MKARIEQAAEEDVRSVNEEITWLVKVGLDVRATKPARRERSLPFIPQKDPDNDHRFDEAGTDGYEQ